MRRRFEHQRTILAEVNVAHGVDDVGVGGRHQGLGVEPLFPDRQDVVASAEDLFRAGLHAERIDQRQRPKIGLRRPLEEQFVAQCLRGFLRGTVFGERQVGQFIEVVCCANAGVESPPIANAQTSAAAMIVFVLVVLFKVCRSPLNWFGHFTFSTLGGIQVPSRMAWSAQ